MKRSKVTMGCCISLVVAHSLLLGGCGLIPQEREYQKVITVEPEDIKKYELAQVVRDDVALTKTVYCTYTQMREDKYSFATEGRRVQFVYVNVGDQVKKGAVLAKLDVADLENTIANLEYTIERNTMLKRHLEEQMELGFEKAGKNLKAGKYTQEEYETELRRVELTYRGNIREYEDNLLISGIRLENYKKELEGSVIYAQMDGMVNSVRSFLEGSYVSSKSTVISVVDSSKCAFRSDTMKDTEYLKPGQNVTIVRSDGTEYHATVMAPEEAPDETHMYFAMDKMDFELAVGTRGTIRVVLEERKDVLSLPRLAVHSANDMYYVFVEDENGLRMMREVTVGLEGNTTREITGGLEEGDIVIRR